jgi:uncharacterized protein YbjT (DUF2867 family)
MPDRELSAGSSNPKSVFISGGTGYVGLALIPELLRRGHGVRALARPGSEKKLPQGCEVVGGNALDGTSFAGRVSPSDTFVHLVGVPHPAPWKGPQFRAIDYTSARASIDAARSAGVAHFVYVSVAHPAPVMKAYWGIRAECESLLAQARLDATVLRPWYVLGPGHRWAYGLLPFYALLERIPRTAPTALRTGLIRLNQMVASLVHAIEHPSSGFRIIEVPEMRGL